jgi:hypothetical protein
MRKFCLRSCGNCCGCGGAHWGEGRCSICGWLLGSPRVLPNRWLYPLLYLAGMLAGGFLGWLVWGWK